MKPALTRREWFLYFLAGVGAHALVRRDAGAASNDSPKEGSGTPRTCLYGGEPCIKNQLPCHPDCEPCRDRIFAAFEELHAAVKFDLLPEGPYSIPEVVNEYPGWGSVRVNADGTWKALDHAEFMRIRDRIARRGRQGWNVPTREQMEHMPWRTQQATYKRKT